MSEFYVGYLPKAPEGIRNRVRLLVGGILIVSLAIALIFAAAQRNFADSNFAFGEPKEYQGTIVQEPFPSLIVHMATEEREGNQSFLLVAPGKHGAESIVDGFAGKNVRLQGTLIQRHEGQMLEVIPGSVAQVADGEHNVSMVRSLGEFTVRGEIVDSKCFLGVMNPGEGKVHRDCAVRCISGGIPPAFVTSDLDGTSKLLLLTDSNGRALRKELYLNRVAQPLQIHGNVLEMNGLYYLLVMPGSVSALH